MFLVTPGWSKLAMDHGKSPICPSLDESPCCVAMKAIQNAKCWVSTAQRLDLSSGCRSKVERKTSASTDAGQKEYLGSKILRLLGCRGVGSQIVQICFRQLGTVKGTQALNPLV